MVSDLRRSKSGAAGLPASEAPCLSSAQCAMAKAFLAFLAFRFKESRNKAAFACGGVGDVVDEGGQEAVSGDEPRTGEASCVLPPSLRRGGESIHPAACVSLHAVP